MDNKTKQESDNIRKSILIAAVELFSKFGYTKTNIIDISNKAGIGKGTIYNYFRSKEELFITMLIEHEKKNIEPIIKEITKKNINPVCKLYKISLEIISWINKIINKYFTQFILSYDNYSNLLPIAAKMMKIISHNLEQALFFYFFSKENRKYFNFDHNKKNEISTIFNNIFAVTLYSALANEDIFADNLERLESDIIDSLNLSFKGILKDPLKFGELIND